MRKLQMRKALSSTTNVIDELRKYNIEPLITISHYENPLHLSLEYGGWKNRKMIDFYLRFAKVLFERYKGRVKYWLTFNEINMLTQDFGAVVLCRNAGPERMYVSRAVIRQCITSW